MGSDIYWLITLYYEYNNTLITCALHTNRDALIEAGCTDDIEEAYMEPENRKVIRDLLPSHVQSVGPIVAIDGLFHITAYC